jgi:formamidopyrimidine-DNA glycosylase
VLAPTSVRRFAGSLKGARFLDLSRRGKYLLFRLSVPAAKRDLKLVGHLGMTGRMYVVPARAPLPKHAAVVLELGREKFIFEDTRYFGRLTLDGSAISRLGPEPLGGDFTTASFGEGLQRSGQAIKVKLLDQRLVAGLGNIYASEALFLAGISPALPARDLSKVQVKKLWTSIRRVLRQAIERGSTLPLDFAGSGQRDGLFYYGRSKAISKVREKFRVYDRAGQPCLTCRTSVERCVQAGRSTFYCPCCQAR